MNAGGTAPGIMCLAVPLWYNLVNPVFSKNCN